MTADLEKTIRPDTSQGEVGPFRKIFLKIRQRWSGVSESPEAAGEIKPESELKEKPANIEEECAQAIIKARETQSWVSINSVADAPVPEGSIRIFRGVKPRGISQEFNAMTLEESEKFRRIMGTPMNQTSFEDKDFIASLGADEKITNDEKWFADSEEHAKDYAEDGVVYSIDLPIETARSSIRWNGKPETSMAFSRTKVIEAVPYAVGPKVPLGASLKFGTEVSESVEIKSNEKKLELQNGVLALEKGYLGIPIKAETFKIVDKVISQVGITRLSEFESQVRAKIERLAASRTLEAHRESQRMVEVLGSIQARKLGFSGAELSKVALARAKRDLVDHQDMRREYALTSPEGLVLTAIDFLRDNRFPDAFKLLRDGNRAASYGYGLIDEKGIMISKDGLSEYTPADIAHAIAQGSAYGITPTDRIATPKTMYLLALHVADTSDALHPRKIPETELPAWILHEVCLVYLEEWLHLLQEKYARNLTDDENLDPEVDVFLFMKKMGVEITQTYQARGHRSHFQDKV